MAILPHVCKLYCIVLYYIILYCIILYYIILYYIILYYIILYYIILYYIILRYDTLRYVVLCYIIYIILYNIILSEKKILHDKDPILNTSLPGCSFLSQPTLSEAGGVGMFVKDNQFFLRRDDLCCTEQDFESLWIEQDTPKQRNIVCEVVYRHPNSNLDNTLNYIYDTVEKLSKENKCCFLMGDFNINLLNYDSHPATADFVNTLSSYSFHSQILKPTRITEHSATLSDNIFFNSLEHLATSGSILSGITGHLPNFIIVNKLSTLPNNLKVYKRDFSSLDRDALLSDVASIDWTSILSGEASASVNDIFQTFYQCISEIIDRHTPLRKLTRKKLRSFSKPWITSGLKVSIKVKDKLYKKYLTTRSVYYHTKYKFYRNRVSSLISISKKKLLSELLQCQQQKYEKYMVWDKTAGYTKREKFWPSL